MGIYVILNGAQRSEESHGFIIEILRRAQNDKNSFLITRLYEVWRHGNHRWTHVYTFALVSVYPDFQANQ